MLKESYRRLIQSPKWLNDCGPALEVINDVKSSSDLKQPSVEGRNKQPTGPVCVTCDGREMSRVLWAKRGRDEDEDGRGKD